MTDSRFLGSPILEASFVSEVLSASIQWDGTAPQSFNVVEIAILLLLGGLEWQRMQQVGKMSPA